MSENKESVASYEEALAWCVTWINDWEQAIDNGNPVGWNWSEGLTGAWYLVTGLNCNPRIECITESKWSDAVKKNKAVTAEEKAALVEEEFTGHSDVKKYVFKVKLVKEGEDYKALSVVGPTILNVIDIIFHEPDYDGWVVVSIVRGSIIDIC